MVASREWGPPAEADLEHSSWKLHQTSKLGPGGGIACDYVAKFGVYLENVEGPQCWTVPKIPSSV